MILIDKNQISFVWLYQEN